MSFNIIEEKGIKLAFSPVPFMTLSSLMCPLKVSCYFQGLNSYLMYHDTFKGKT